MRFPSFSIKSFLIKNLPTFLTDYFLTYCSFSQARFDQSNWTYLTDYALAFVFAVAAVIFMRQSIQKHPFARIGAVLVTLYVTYFNTVSRRRRVLVSM